ncbi:hypothetical protein AAFP30_08285 [Gordonia sp. CPCC 205515]|uniref:hypothetical protein n=1 Tax=Gordonia sp. CPCC 205515 TaxID=3140791 RepID=UPI003AF401B4
MKITSAARINWLRRGVAAAVLAGAAVSGGFVAAGAADAYPVGPWRIEGPCKGATTSQCPMSPSRDGLTWSFHGDAWNYDKTGRFVCMSSAIYCGPLVTVIRALPPVQIGSGPSTIARR